MRNFTELFRRLDETNKTNTKVEALVEYFSKAEDADKVWAIALLSGRRPKRSVRTTDLREWAAELSGLPLWLFEETYHVVGDLAETIAKVLPHTISSSEQSLKYWMDYILSLQDMDLDQRRSRVIAAWNLLDEMERFVFNKMMLGSYRIGLSQKLMVRALSAHTGKHEHELSHRLMGKWDPATTSFEDLILNDQASTDLSKPYPFYLAYQLEDINSIGEPADWLAEFKWDGIRGQLVVRQGKHFIWSRGEELITDKFPEFEGIAGLLPDDCVLDGEILAYKNGVVLPFQDLQIRIGRKNVSKKVLEKSPVVLRVYDILEHQGKDLRSKPQKERREVLENLFNQTLTQDILQISEVISFGSWQELAEIRSHSREKNAEGVMLKKKEGIYRVGRKKGDWWKWKVDPLTVDAVLIYAMRGHGRRANLYTDYTFAVWDKNELIPFAKAYSGLTDEEFRKVDNFVKRNTLERFGPVRSVKPELVFELAFEGIQKSNRHKSGVALRFPRMSRWRHDKPVEEANTLNDLHELLKQYGS